jgi:hypothetical protein
LDVYFGNGGLAAGKDSDNALFLIILMIKLLKALILLGAKLFSNT